jgi:hypothetical protein
MSEQDDNQVTNDATAQSANADKPELSLADELAQANDKTSDDETKPENNEAEEAKPDEPVSDQKAEEQPAEAEAEKETDDEKERKRHNYEMAQRRIQERESQKRQVEQTIDQAYQPQPVDQLTQYFMDQGADQFQAEMLARDEVRNQRDQINTVRTQVAELNMQIETEAVQVMHDFPVFDPNSSEYDPDFANKASAMYQKAAGVQVDPRTGVVISTNQTPYTFYKELAEMRQHGMSKAQIAAQKAAEQQMASVAPPTSSAPVVNKSKDDEEADRVRAAFDKTA